MDETRDDKKLWSYLESKQWQSECGRRVRRSRRQYSGPGVECICTQRRAMQLGIHLACALTKELAINMYIAEEWLQLEREVLGQRPLISGPVAQVRAAYAQTSEQLQALYPPLDAYRVRDREPSLTSVPPSLRPAPPDTPKHKHP